MYLVALFKDNRGICSVFAERGCENKGDLIKHEEKYLKELGYKLVSCIITSNRTLYIKTRLKAKVEELKSLDPNLNYYGYDESLMRSIGILVNRVQGLGVEVTDEIALQCKDYRDQKILEKHFVGPLEMI